MTEVSVDDEGVKTFTHISGEGDYKHVSTHTHGSEKHIFVTWGDFWKIRQMTFDQLNPNRA
ncbi:hypothetical protein [Vibrio phage vB_VmeM-Yong XC32]|nr:hypothetical protein [Vibrio phage vB_VmeM-Yong XC31]QAX96618.1 hypothetical protein [Vibrio phage vB_VmeM-Yong XC32]QAX96936.1 hypothetical protein [Vibrio phage vB_VmeM-Yong MS31]QAX97241.1 hypothetical protein [Vibrio phage vB_VmeM-Yong MS32]